MRGVPGADAHTLALQTRLQEVGAELARRICPLAPLFVA